MKLFSLPNQCRYTRVLFFFFRLVPLGIHFSKSLLIFIINLSFMSSTYKSFRIFICSCFFFFSFIQWKRDPLSRSVDQLDVYQNDPKPIIIIEFCYIESVMDLRKLLNVNKMPNFYFKFSRGSHLDHLYSLAHDEFPSVNIFSLEFNYRFLCSPYRMVRHPPRR